MNRRLLGIFRTPVVHGIGERSTLPLGFELFFERLQVGRGRKHPPILGQRSGVNGF